LRTFYEKRIGQEVHADDLGDEFKGYVFKVAGGNDKQGFPMRQGIVAPGRVKLLFADGSPCYRIRRRGERRRKSIRGCIVGSDLAALNLIIIKQGEKDIEGLTDVQAPKRLGPKRANNIRKFFGSRDWLLHRDSRERELSEHTRSRMLRPREMLLPSTPSFWLLVCTSVRLKRLRSEREELLR